jgi:hypothetical protein
MPTALTTPVVLGKTATQFDIQFSAVDFPNLSITVNVLLYDANDVLLQQQSHTLSFADVGLDPSIAGPLFQGITAKLISLGVVN